MYSCKQSSHALASATSAFLPVVAALGSASFTGAAAGKTLEICMRLLIALAAASALGLAACTQADQNQAEQDANQAAQETGQALENAGEDLSQAANQTGEAIEGATNEAAGAVERATDDNENTQP